MARDTDQNSGKNEDTKSSDAIQSIKTVAKGGSFKFGGRIITLALGLVVQIVMARLLVPDSYGSVTLALTVLFLSLRFGTLGVDSGITHLYPIHEDDPSKARGVVRALFRVSLVSGVAIAVLLFITAPIIAGVAFDEPKLVPLLRIIAVGIPFAVLGQNAIALARAARDVRPRVYIYDILRPLLRLGLIAALIYAGFETVGAVGGHMLAMVVAGILAVLVVLRILPSWEENPKVMDRKLLMYSLPLLFASGLGFLMNNIDTLMIGYFLSSTNVGTYNISYQLGTLAIFFLTAGGYILPPMLAKKHSEDQQSQMDELYRTITKWIAFASAPVVLTLVVYPNELITMLFSANYVGGSNVLRILVLGTFVSIIFGTAGSALTSLGNNRIVLYTVAAAACINIVLNVTLIPIAGIVGAAIATMVGTATNAGLNAAMLMRRYSLLPLGFLGLRTIMVAAFAAGALFLTAQNTALPTILAGSLWIAVYPFLIFALGVNARDEKIFRAVEDRMGVEIPLLEKALSLRNSFR